MGLVPTVGFEPPLDTLSKCSLYQLGYVSTKSRRRESNPVGLAYDASALTVEHRRHGVAVVGFEPARDDGSSIALRPVWLHRHGVAGGTCTRTDQALRLGPLYIGLRRLGADERTRTSTSRGHQALNLARISSSATSARVEMIGFEPTTNCLQDSSLTIRAHPHEVPPPGIEPEAGFNKNPWDACPITAARSSEAVTGLAPVPFGL
jgi:hypothetical protein